MGVVLGALAGLTVGIIVAQRMGGVSGIRSRLRRARHGEPATGHQFESPEDYEYAAYGADELEEDATEGLEDHVLEAFRNDPILSERAVDIGAIGDGVIELAGWVESEREVRHAVTIARGVPGVDTVVNRIVVGDEERVFEDAARRARNGDPALTEARWEGQQVGTGRRRQGSSAEPDRHADPRVTLEDRWLSESEAVRNAAEDMEGLAERRKSHKRAPRGDRTGGAPVAPTGVPKGDHVASPVETTRDTGGEMTDFGDRP